MKSRDEFLCVKLTGPMLHPLLKISLQPGTPSISAEPSVLSRSPESSIESLPAAIERKTGGEKYPSDDEGSPPMHFFDIPERVVGAWALGKESIQLWSSRQALVGTIHTWASETFSPRISAHHGFPQDRENKLELTGQVHLSLLSFPVLLAASNSTRAHERVAFVPFIFSYSFIYPCYINPDSNCSYLQEFCPAHFRSSLI